MKTHTNQFKENVKKLGRELDSVVTYSIDNEEYELRNEQINSVTLFYEGDILKSVMKQLDIDSDIEIPLNTVINYRFGIKINDEYEYLDFGNYIVYKIEKQEDVLSYKITCYDKMLYSMINYENVGVTYPTTIRNYINAVCSKLGLTFKNTNDTFVNYDKEIANELFLDANGNDLGYTFRDVFDQLAEVTASTICINEDDELEIRYINDTEDTIDEEYLKDINVNFGEKFGPVNSIVLSRSAESDNVYLQDEESITQNGLTEIKISENQFMNFNNRDEFLPDILEKLDGLEYYINDFASFGICYYDLCDKYNVLIGENNYNCIMLNNEINITQGLEENIYTKLTKKSKTDYSKADKTDRKINQTTLMVDKQQGTIEGLVSEISELNGVVNENFTKVYQDISNVITSVQTAGGNNLLKNSVMFAYNEDGEPDEWDFGKTTITYNNEQVLYSNETINVGGTEGLTIQSDTEALNAGSISAHSFTLKNGMVRQKIIVTPNTNENDNNYYAFSTKIKKNLAGSCYVKIYNSNEEYKIELNSGQEAYYSDYSIQSIFPTLNYFIIEFYGSEESGATFTDNMFTVGEYPKQWQQATGEIMNTQVNININGVLVKSAQYAGNYTIMSPLEFAGYANVNGVITKVFSLNNDVTEVEKLEARKQIQMPPIKIVPITSGDMQGWAFVPIAGGDE